MLALQIFMKTTELVGSPNICPEAVRSTDWPLRDHYVTRIVWSAVAKVCWQVLGSIIKKVYVHLGRTFL